jgi:hypothetical protein
LQRQLINDLKKQNEQQLEALDAKLVQFNNCIKKELDIFSNGCADRCVNEIVHKLEHTEDIHKAAGLAAQSVNNACVPVTDENSMQCEMTIQPAVQVQLSSATSVQKGLPVHYQQQQQQRQRGSNNRPQSFRSNYMSSTAAESGDDGGDFQEYHGRLHRRLAKRRLAEEKPLNEQQPRIKVIGKSNTLGLRAHGNIVEEYLLLKNESFRCLTWIYPIQKMTLMDFYSTLE